MWAYLLTALGVAVASMLFLYIESRLLDRPKKKIIYFKVICMNVIITLSVVYILTWLSSGKGIKEVVQTRGLPKIMTGGGCGGEGVISVPQIGEEMLAGDAPF